MAADKKAAAPAKKKKGLTQVWKNYEKSGDSVKLKNKTCPKCGPSFLMAAHKNRITCGKCNYTEFVTEKK